MSWNQQQPWGQPAPPEPSFVSADVRDERVGAFLTRVYAWMGAGLLITAAVAWGVASTPVLINALIANRIAFWAIVISQFGVVLYLSARVEKMAPTTAAVLFLLYAALVGVTTSVVLLIFTGASIAQTFIITAGMFGAMAVFGTFTKRSLAGVGQFMFMGLIGLILSIVGIFWQNSALQFVIAIVGVIVFTGLTAWDAQRMKQMAVSLPDGRVGAYAVVGALSLYLDFINLFFSLLRLMGDRRS